MKKYILLVLFFSVFVFAQNERTKMFHPYYTFETEHFILNYEINLEHSAREIATILERIYPIYRDKYAIVLPKKTNVLVSNSAFSGGWALTLQNTIGIWVNDMDWNMRGTPNWLENVVVHEYAHIASISNSYKMPYWMPYFQVGYFNHPNEKNTAEIMHIYPSEILPPWFFEGIAQYEASKNGAESWDSHRDMILRTLTLSDSLLSWDKMSVFNGRADDYEKVYNHGFSLVKYIAETYGDDKIFAIVKESSRFGRLVFDNSIKAVLGMKGRELYDEWKRYLQKKYAEQKENLGELTEDKLLTKAGFDNFWAKYSNDEEKIYFLSNMGSESYFKMLYELDNSSDSAKAQRDVPDTNDTAENSDTTTTDTNDVKIRMLAPQINQFYSIDNENNAIYMSAASLKSRLSHNQGGEFVYDIHKSTIPSDTTKRALRTSMRESEQITFKKNYQNPVFSPDGKQVAAIHHDRDKHFLVIGNLDSTLSNTVFEEVYPPRNDEKLKIRTMYSLDWSSDGNNIAVSYFDKDFRKIGIYNIPSKSFYSISDNTCDDRDPRFSKDGKTLYFSSNRTGIFNIYRINGSETEQITNVVSGAFAPDVSKDESEIIYSAYSSDGYKIYKAEISPPEEKIGLVLNERELPNFSGEYLSGSRKNYSYFPRKWIVIPTLMAESVVSDNDNPYKGVMHTKYGAVVGIMDPLFWLDKGNMLTVFYLTGNLFKQISAPFTDMSRNLLVPYDIGVMYDSYIFPFDMSILYFTRNVPTESDFIHNYLGYDTLETTNYSIQPSMIQLSLTKPIMTRYPTTHITPGIFTSFTNYRMRVRIDENEGEDNMQYLWYDPADLFRIGGLISYGNMPRYSSSNALSPKGFMAQFQYDFNHGNYANNEEVLKIEDGKIKENNESYNFNSYKFSLFLGKPSWIISEKVDFALQFNASVVKETKKTADKIKRNYAENPKAYHNDLPDFFYPVQKVPGYSYSYRADSTMQMLIGQKGDTTYEKMSEDSLVASDKVLLELHGSYRFPLTSPKGIAKKFWIFYFDRIYGAVNFGGVLPARSLRDLEDKTIDDALLYAGAELRISTFIFNSNPLAIGFRYDRGISRDAPVGGNRFTLTLGMEFNNGTIISQPDGIRYAPEIVRDKIR